jgi:glycosyltransferase involved in cell wall biosynthesis
MKIGFDAKRAFFNKSGLGNYSRDTISILSDFFPMNDYILYSPKPSKSLLFNKIPNISIKGPVKFLDKLAPAFWRTYKLSEQIVDDKIQLFHGLSNELPIGIEKTGVPSIVTIHDIIFMRFPQLYKSIDRKIYERKSKYAARRASRVIAVSQQTKEDLIKFFNIAEEKIEVVYQGCHPFFWEKTDDNKKAEIVMKYSIPDKFILYVGTIEERKNLLNILKALQNSKINFPLVVIGRQTGYYNTVTDYIDKYKIKNVYFLHNVPNDDLPAFYQKAIMFIYPSLFEGFGIPILEALTSKTPVITTKGGCFSEAGGKSSLYVDPENVDELGQAISSVLNNETLRNNMIIDGFIHAQQFKRDKIASNILAVYDKVIK